jgi:Domain of unknown function (DUF932)
MFSPMILTDEELSTRAPSVSTDHASPSRSARYCHIPTTDVVTALRVEGYDPVHASGARVRDVARIPYARHLIRFRHRESVPVLNEGFPEIILRNDHGGAGSFRLQSGFFRLLCLNGLVIQSADFGTIRVRHSADAVSVVVAGVHEVATRATMISERIESMRLTHLSPERAESFAAQAIALRYGTTDRPPVDSLGLLKARRYEDAGLDLWSTYNRVQENLIKGARPSYGYDPGRTPSGRIRTMRPVRSGDIDLSLNAGLWDLAETFATT